MKTNYFLAVILFLSTLMNATDDQQIKNKNKTRIAFGVGAAIVTAIIVFNVRQIYYAKKKDSKKDTKDVQVGDPKLQPQHPLNETVKRATLYINKMAVEEKDYTPVVELLNTLHAHKETTAYNVPMLIDLLYKKYNRGQIFFNAINNCYNLSSLSNEKFHSLTAEALLHWEYSTNIDNKRRAAVAKVVTDLDDTRLLLDEKTVNEIFSIASEPYAEQNPPQSVIDLIIALRDTYILNFNTATQRYEALIFNEATQCYEVL